MALGEVDYGLMGVVGGLTAGVGCVRFWYNNGCMDTLREVGDCTRREVMRDILEHTAPVVWRVVLCIASVAVLVMLYQ